MSDSDDRHHYEKLVHSCDVALAWLNRVGPMDDLTDDERQVVLAIRLYIREALRDAADEDLSAKELLRRARKIERACLTLTQIHLRRKLRE